MKANLEILAAYLLIFAPLLFFAFRGEAMQFIVYGATIALLNTLVCLIRQIQADMKANRPSKGKRG